jgi:hypothetical protein
MCSQTSGRSPQTSQPISESNPGSPVEKQSKTYSDEEKEFLSKLEVCLILSGSILRMTV